MLPDEAVAGFHPPRCLVCQSDLVKPDVVFFGESVPKVPCHAMFLARRGSSGLVVLGSSLQVMSGYRFVRRAAANGIPVAILTQGPSRGDEQATIRLDQPLGTTLSRIVQDLRGSQDIGPTRGLLIQTGFRIRSGPRTRSALSKGRRLGDQTLRRTAVTLPRMVALSPSMGE